MLFSFMTFSTPGLSWTDVLATAVRYGYGAVEPRLDSSHAHGVEVAASAADRRSIRDLADRRGIRICCLATSQTFADPRNAEEQIGLARERIDLAGDLGVPVLRVFGGSIPEGIERGTAADSILRALAAIADQAADRGVTVAIETHDDWCAPSDVAALLERVPHPAVAANWDILHPVRRGGATMDEAFERLCPRIGHVHVHDGVRYEGRNRLVPIGQGDIDHRCALRCLRRIGYTGAVSGEWIRWEPFEMHLPREIATLRTYLSDAAD